MKKYLILLLLATLCLTGCSKNSENTPSSTSEQINYSQLAVTAITKLTSEKTSDFYKLFDEQMQKELTEQELKEIWDSLENQLGDFQYYSSNFTITSPNNSTVVDVPCVFKNGTMTIRLTFNTTGKVSGLFLLDSVSTAKVSPRLTRDTEVTIGKAPWILPGSLTLPEGKGPFPLVILIHGSGPTDRNEQIGPNLPFLDLANQLADLGIATLRYDKRTYAYPAEVAGIAEPTVKDEVIDDVLAAVEFAQSRSEIDSEQIYLAGHSLGGMLIPRIAPQTPTVAGYVILAAPARPLEDLIVEQNSYILSTDHIAEDSAKEQLRQQTEAMASNVKSLSAESTFSSKELFNLPASYWLDLQNYHQLTEAAKMNEPLLVLQGGRDYQVTKTDFQLWQDALSDQPNVTFQYYDNLNHFFMTGTGKSIPEEYQVKGTLCDKVSQDMANFIHEHK